MNSFFMLMISREARERAGELNLPVHYTVDLAGDKDEHKKLRADEDPRHAQTH